MIHPANLIPYARNAKRHDEQQVAKIAGSIREFGFNNPVLIDQDNGIIAGHGRVMAALKLGLEEVPVIRLTHLSDIQRRAYILADNKLAELGGGWDEEMLKVELEAVKESDLDHLLTGFTEEELTELLKEDKELNGDPDEVPEAPEEPTTKPGDLWLLGNHRLLCGDSTKAEDVERLMAGAKADICFTDPPYGISVVPSSGKIGGSVLGKNRTYHAIHGDDVPFSAEHLWSMASSFVVWGANYFPSGLPHRGQWIVWDKGRPEGTTFSDAELAWTDGDGVAVKMYRCVWNGMTRQGESGERVHPTQKPVKLTTDVLNDFGGDLVMDPYLGSGTTLIAAEQLGRKCYGMEISPAYCDVIVKRWETLTGKKATLEPR